MANIPRGATLSVGGAAKATVESLDYAVTAETIPNLSDGSVYEQEPGITKITHKLTVVLLHYSVANSLTLGASAALVLGTWINSLAAGGNNTVTGTAKLIRRTPGTDGKITLEFVYESSDGSPAATLA